MKSSQQPLVLATYNSSHMGMGIYQQPAIPSQVLYSMVDRSETLMRSLLALMYTDPA